MKLPHVEQAIIERTKITEYLLAEHDDSDKAGFFRRFGFSSSEWQILATALHDHVTRHPVMLQQTTVHGVKYVIEGELQTPDQRNPQIRSVWIIEHGKTVPRLVTAYPLKRRAT